MSRSAIKSMARSYLFVTLGAPVLMILGTLAFIGCLVCLFMDVWDDSVARALVYINVSISIFMAGCALILYRGTVLTDIARELFANGSQGTATILESSYNGRLQVERHKHWYVLKLSIEPSITGVAPFTVDIEQLFHRDIASQLTVGSVVPVRFSTDSDLFAVVALQQAYALLK